MSSVEFDEGNYGSENTTMTTRSQNKSTLAKILMKLGIASNPKKANIILLSLSIILIILTISIFIYSQKQTNTAATFTEKYQSIDQSIYVKAQKTPTNK